jgi:hypothetical protein
MHKNNQVNISIFYLPGEDQQALEIIILAVRPSGLSVRLLLFQLTKRTSHGLAIELYNNKLHGLLPTGGLVSLSGGFASFLCDQGLHFASIKLCQASWM